MKMAAQRITSLAAGSLQPSFPAVSSRKQPVVVAVVVLIGVWILAYAGFAIAKNAKVTGEKVRAYMAKNDLAKLHGRDRAKALKQLADYMNQLPQDERRTTRMDREWEKWFKEMNEQEKGEFIDATLPTGVKQMLTAFEQLPPEKRAKAVSEGVKRMREARDDPRNRAQWEGRDAPPPLSKDLEKRVIATGFGAFYSQSSAQTKAELAPLLEELQRSMESGRMLRPGR